MEMFDRTKTIQNTFFVSESLTPLKCGIGNFVSREIDANNVYYVQPGNVIVSLW